MPSQVSESGQLLLDALPDAHVVIDNAGTLLAANALFDRRLLTQPRVLQHFAHCDITPVEIAADIDGQRRVLRAVWRELDWQGTSARLVRLSDVTDERLHAALVERNLHALEDVIDVLPSSLLLVDGDGIIRSGNVRWHVTGRAAGLLMPRDGIGCSYLAVCDRSAAAGDVQAAQAAAGIREVLARRTMAYEQEYCMEIDGEVQWYRLAVNALSGEPGAVIQHIDTTTAHRDQKARIDALAHFKAVFDGALDGIVIYDDAMRVLDANPAASGFTGFDQDTTTPVLLTDMVVPGDRERLVEQHEAVLADGTGRGRLHLRRRDDTVLEVEYACRANVVPGRHVAVIRDLSASRALETQLRQAQKMEALGQLTGGIAHDFNNILTVIVAHSDMLLADDSVADDTRDSVAEVLRASQRGADMVRKLMAFGRREQLHVEPTRIDVVMHDVAGILRRVLPETILVECTSNGAVPVAMADASAIQQILLNLATNARDAMRDTGGTLRLVVGTAVGQAQASERSTRVMRPIRHIVMSVSDTGCGMAEETLAHVFEPFYTTKGPGEGTGLGMAMVYGLMEQMLGQVTVESAVGKGTTVHLHFPIATDQRETPPGRAAGPTVQSHGQEHVLLVEDDDAIRALSARVLRRAGYEVTEAMSGNQAAEFLAQRASRPRDKFDVVVSDVVMPHGDGARVLEAVRHYAANGRLVWVTGYAGGFTSGDVHAPCDAPIIQKPWTTSDFLARIRAVLDGPPNVPPDSPVTHAQHRAG